MAEPVVQLTPESYQAFWNGWMWTALIAGAVFSSAFWAIGYWVVRMAVAHGLSDMGR
jgi:di/tricarboxylate transporter